MVSLTRFRPSHTGLAVADCHGPVAVAWLFASNHCALAAVEEPGKAGCRTCLLVILIKGHLQLPGHPDAMLQGIGCARS